MLKRLWCYKIGLCAFTRKILATFLIRPSNNSPCYSLSQFMMEVIQSWTSSTVIRTLLLCSVYEREQFLHPPSPKFQRAHLSLVRQGSLPYEYLKTLCECNVQSKGGILKKNDAMPWSRLPDTKWYKWAVCEWVTPNFCAAWIQMSSEQQRNATWWIQAIFLH